jgi:hypothetical protein
MKTSNYIIIAFVIFVLGCCMALAIDSKKHEHDTSRHNEDSFIQKTFLIPGFSVIVAEGNNLQMNEDSDSLKVMYPKDIELNEDFFQVRNDTLYLKNDMRINVYCKTPSSVIANNSTISFNPMVTISKINLSANHSQIRIYSSKLDSVFANIKNHSYLHCSKSVKFLMCDRDSSMVYWE